MTGADPPDPVYVIGAGPAGLAAALALARGSIPVRVVERAGLLGGKVNSHRAQDRSLEHGVHGWWVNYINFDQLLRWADVDPSAALVEARSSTLVEPNGTRHSLTTLATDLPSPLFLIVQFFRAPFLSKRDFFSLFSFFIHTLAFDHRTDYGRYDDFSFQALMDFCGVSPTVQRLLLTPFILSFDFTTPDRVSAACGLSGLQLYMIRDQRSALARWARGLPAEVLFAPIGRAIAARGGELRFDTALRSVRVEDGRLTGVHLSVSGAPAVEAASEVVLGRVPTASVPSQGFVPVTTSGGPVMVGRVGSAVRALSAMCTHQGCTVAWDAAASGFSCPCHGGRFDQAGAVVNGPPTRPLRAVRSTVEGPDIVLWGPSAPRAEPCSDVILATDLASAQAVVAESVDLATRLRHDIGHLDTTPELIVRLWFDRSCDPLPEIESAFTPEFAVIDNFFRINSFDAQIDAEGTVIEVQGYRPDALFGASDETVLDTVFADLAHISHGYRREALRSYTINRFQRLFTRYGPGQHPFRPGAESGTPGLYLAGDWTHDERGAWMMERAVVSGFQAANAVLRRRGRPEVPVLLLPAESVVLRVARLIALGIRLTLLRRLPMTAEPTAHELHHHMEGDHAILGWVALCVAAGSFLALLSTELRGLLAIWPVLFGLIGVYFFLHTEPDVRYRYGSWLRAWADHGTLDHRLMNAGAAAVSVAELGRVHGYLTGAWSDAAFPTGLVVGGVLILSHHHGDAVLIERQHQIMGALGILTGFTWLGARLIPSLLGLSYAWPLIFAVLAFVFITYIEHTHDAIEDGHDHAGEHAHVDGTPSASHDH
ncbi:MAG TPA: FAD-dependent oxidoreductase [Candidatus Limnocylindria bacterium]